jgi:hypothetical protein
MVDYSGTQMFGSERLISYCCADYCNYSCVTTWCTAARLYKCGKISKALAIGITIYHSTCSEVVRAITIWAMTYYFMTMIHC